MNSTPTTSATPTSNPRSEIAPLRRELSAALESPPYTAGLSAQADWGVGRRRKHNINPTPPETSSADARVQIFAPHHLREHPCNLRVIMQIADDPRMRRIVVGWQMLCADRIFGALQHSAYSAANVQNGETSTRTEIERCAEHLTHLVDGSRKIRRLKELKPIDGQVVFVRPRLKCAPTRHSVLHMPGAAVSSHVIGVGDPIAGHRVRN